MLKSTGLDIILILTDYLPLHKQQKIYPQFAVEIKSVTSEAKGVLDLQSSLGLKDNSYHVDKSDSTSLGVSSPTSQWGQYLSLRTVARITQKLYVEGWDLVLVENNSHQYESESVFYFISFELFLITSDLQLQQKILFFPLCLSYLCVSWLEYKYLQPLQSR